MNSLTVPMPAQMTGPAAAVVHTSMQRLRAFEGTIRVSFARRIIDALNDLGADPGLIVRQAGLDPRLFDNPDNVIPFVSVGRLLKLGVARTGCEHLGLRAGEKALVSDLGIVGGLMANASSVRAALETLVEHLHLIDEGAVTTLAVSDGLALITYGIAEPGVECTDQMNDLAVAVLAVVIRQLCGDDWRPSEILLPRRRPFDRGPYTRFFRAPVRFDEEEAVLVFPAAWLDRPVSGADAAHQRFFRDRIRDLKAAHDPGLSTELRRVLRSRMAKGDCSVSAVADTFALHRRTLNRRLRAEGTKFRRLAAETRFEIARQLLIDTSVPLVQVAIALGYSEASAFTRAFKRWSGHTPSEWRSRKLRISLDAAGEGLENGATRISLRTQSDPAS